MIWIVYCVITTEFNTQQTLPELWYWVSITPMPDSYLKIEKNIISRMAFIDVWAHGTR